MKQEKSIDLSQIFYVLNKRKSVIITITLVAVIISAIFSFFIISPTYQSQVTLIVGKNNDANNKNVQYDEVMMYQNLTKTYASIGTSKSVEKKALEKLGNPMKAEELDKLIAITSDAGTQILILTANGNTPEEAFNIANAVSESFVDYSKQVYDAGDLKIMDKAQLPDQPIKPRKALNIAIALMLGLMISIGLSFLLEYMDSTIKTQEDVKKHLDLPVLGTIPVHEEM